MPLVPGDVVVPVLLPGEVVLSLGEVVVLPLVPPGVVVVPLLAPSGEVVVPLVPPVAPPVAPLVPPGVVVVPLLAPPGEVEVPVPLVPLGEVVLGEVVASEEPPEVPLLPPLWAEAESAKGKVAKLMAKAPAQIVLETLNNLINLLF